MGGERLEIYSIFHCDSAYGLYTYVYVHICIT